MTDLFPPVLADTQPLADRLRPAKLADVVGQDHLLGPSGPIGRMLAAKRLGSMILWGPPGCGKTTLARLLAAEAGLTFEPLSAVMSGIAELRKLFEAAAKRRAQGKGTLLFIDEIHRFNRSQQDGFLPVVEDGTVILVGATTENPSFSLNAAVLSRAQVFVLKRLEEKGMALLLDRAEALTGQPLPLTAEARELLLTLADGDGRYLLNLAEALFALKDLPPLDSAGLLASVQKRAPLYDRDREEHYNLISALHKSLRGSDVDAALYWFQRMLLGGEDPHFIARRLTRFAAEDIGLADPNALPQAIAAWDAYDKLGSPEGELALAQAVVYLATAPKSNATYRAFKNAAKAARDTGSMMPPKHILNAPTRLMKDIGYGAGYAYDHDTADGFSGQNYFPENLPRTRFYDPPERGFEREIRKRLEYWDKLRAKRQEGTE
jgi:putative ATPase